MRTILLSLALIPLLAAAEPSALPNRAERIRALDQAGLHAAELAKLDELDQDLLYLRAKTKPESLPALYPDLPVLKLEKLGRAIGGAQ